MKIWRDHRHRAVGGMPKSAAGHARRSWRLPTRNPASGAGRRSTHPIFGDALHGGRLPFIAENADRRARQRPLSAAGAPAARARQTDGVPAGAGGDARPACRHQRRRGRSNLNDTSIGIEIVNKGFTRSMLFTHWQPYTAEQIAVLIPLSRDIVQRYGIQPQDVVGHSDIAPQRKQDPGPLFPGGSWPEPVSAHGRTNETCSVCWRGAIVMRRYRWCRCSKSWRVTAMRSTRHGMRGSSAMWWRRFRCTSGPTMCAASRMQRVKRLSMRCW